MLKVGQRDRNHPAARRAPADFALEWYSGSGAGGQHRNKHQNSARLRHLPTGIVVTAQSRKRDESLAQAEAAMTQRLDDLWDGVNREAENNRRADQIGSGMRADKRRTYRFRDDQVVDHLTGRAMSCAQVMKGGFNLLW